MNIWLVAALKQVNLYLRGSRMCELKQNTGSKQELVGMVMTILLFACVAFLQIDLEKPVCAGAVCSCCLCPLYRTDVSFLRRAQQISFAQLVLILQS